MLDSADESGFAR